MFAPLSRENVKSKAEKLFEESFISVFVQKLEAINEDVFLSGGYLFYSFSRSENNNYPVVISSTNETIVLPFFAGKTSEISSHYFSSKEAMISGIVKYYRELLISDKEIDGFISHYKTLDPDDFENEDAVEDNFYYSFFPPFDMYAIEFEGFNIDNIS